MITTAVNSWEQELLRAEEEDTRKNSKVAGAALGGLRRSRASARQMLDDDDAGKKKNLDHAALKAKVDEALASVAFAEMLSTRLLEMKRAMDEARVAYQGALDTAAERLACIPVDQFISALPPRA